MKTLHISIRPRSPPAACAPDRPLVPPSTPRPFAAYPSLSLGNLAETKTKFMNVFCHVWMADCLTDRPTDSLTDWPVRQYDCQAEGRGTPTRKHTHTFMHLAAACRILERKRHCDKMFLLLFFCLFVYTATAAATSGMRHAACVAHVAHTHTRTHT